MKAIDIQKFPTAITFEKDRLTYNVSGGIHESLFRSWFIVKKVVEELEAGTPAQTILELIELMQTDPVEKYLGDAMDNK